MRVSLRGGSALVGRNADCDVVLTGDTVSRHHALFRVVGEGVEVIPLGRLGLAVNGAHCAEPRLLREGDVVSVARHQLVLRGEEVAGEGPAVHWFVEQEPGALVRIGAELTAVGGGPEDRLSIAAWEPFVMALHLVGERLVLEARTAGIRVGRVLDVGDLLTLQSGDRVEHRGASFRAIALPADPSKPTGVPVFDEPPSAVTLTLLPRGGRLTVVTGTRVCSAWLSERRCELLALLVRPPSPFAPGEMIPDAEIADRLWPGADSGRLEINTLVCRVRKDLEHARIDSVVLIERRAGALRLVLAAGATATLETS